IVADSAVAVADLGWFCTRPGFSGDNVRNVYCFRGSIMSWRSWRRQWLTEPLYRMAREAMPSLSLTEQQAIEAGDVWWDAQLFSGRPDWRALLEVPPVALSEEEQAFIDGPVAQLCHMLNDWDITWHDADLPA